MPFALITRLLTGEAGVYFARLRSLIAWYAIMGLFAFVMTVFLTIALFSWMASHLGTLPAALIFAGIFFVLTLVAFAVAQVSGKPPRTRKEDRLHRDIASIAGVTAMANAPQLFRLAKQKRGLLIIPAVLAGFVGLYKAIEAVRSR